MGFVATSWTRENEVGAAGGLTANPQEQDPITLRFFQPQHLLSCLFFEIQEVLQNLSTLLAY